jgi:hypothetical protein
MADIQKSLPAGMKIETRLFRQADFIEVSIANLMAALRDGAILVVAIVFAFLLSVRSTAITLVALPLSLVAAVLSLKALGATINTMTLGGMAIALGALVDDAIIVVENIVRRLRQNLARPEGRRESTMHVVFLATREIQGSIVFATLIIMLVFVPLFFLSGIEGRLMVPLGLAYVISLFASLLVSITVTPVLASMFLGDAREVRQDHETRLTGWLRAGYRRLLDATLERWLAISLASGGLLVAALLGLGFAGQSFLPDFNEGTLTISAESLPAPRCRVGQARADGRGGAAEPSEVVATAAHRPFPARSPRARRASVGNRGIAENGNRRQCARQGGLARRAARRLRQAAGPAGGDRPADLAPHRPYAVGLARQHRGENLRQRAWRTAPAGRAGQDGHGRRRGRRRCAGRTADRDSLPHHQVPPRRWRARRRRWKSRKASRRPSMAWS